MLDRRSTLAAMAERVPLRRLGQVEDFPFLEAPRAKAIADGYDLLGELGAGPARERAEQRLAAFVAAQAQERLAPLGVLERGLAGGELRGLPRGLAHRLIEAGGVLDRGQVREEAKGFGGFPVSGQWLRCDNPEVVAKHQAKVYSQAEVGAPFRVRQDPDAAQEPHYRRDRSLHHGRRGPRPGFRIQNGVHREFSIRNEG